MADAASVILARVNEMERAAMLVDESDLFVARATAPTVEAMDCRSKLLPELGMLPLSSAVVRRTEEDASTRAFDVAVLRLVSQSVAPFRTEATT